MLKHTSKYLIIFCPIIFVVILIIFLNDINIKLQQIKTAETNQLTILTTAINDKITIFTSDLHILSKNNFFKQFLQNKNDFNKKNIEQLFSLVINETKQYEQAISQLNKKTHASRTNSKKSIRTLNHKNQ